MGGLVKFVLCVPLVFVSFHVSAQTLDLGRLLPSWPISNVGDSIPDNLISAWTGMSDKCPGIPGKFSSFPSKGNGNPDPDVRERQGKNPDRRDPSDHCDDGDQTTFNGLLCASGVEAGCIGVAQAQDGAGRFFRSPHRKWKWENRCFDRRHPLNTAQFNDDCAYGFSPDMNLGVLLYVLKARKPNVLARWLKWLDTNSATTVLCKKNGDQFYDCVKVEWPRVCTDDLGNGQEPGDAIDGRYGGKCALRPTDALDFAAVEEALAVSPPTRMSNWEVKSRLIIAAAPGLLAGGIGSGVPTLILGSTIDPAHFPLHLDAIRVLARMMIRNPTLELNNLPTMPDPNDALPGALNLISSDATDPVTVNAAARIISARAPWNPFYQLLADGPTSDVRSKIIDRCPASSDHPDKSNWIWEKNNDDASNKTHSMGWDCVFVGRLYNKMRVKKSIWDELLALFLRYGDVLGVMLNHASQALQVAQAAHALEVTALNEAEAALNSTQQFVNEAYARQRRAAEESVAALTEQLSNLQRQRTDLQQKVDGLLSNVSRLPEMISQEYEERLPCPPLDPFCREVRRRVRQITNPAKQEVRKKIEAAQKELRKLDSDTITASQAQLARAHSWIAELDRDLQVAHNRLQQRTLQTAVSVARASLAAKAAVLEQSRKSVGEVKKAHANVKGHLCVWKRDANCNS